MCQEGMHGKDTTHGLLHGLLQLGRISFPKIFCGLWVFWDLGLVVFFIMRVYSLAVKIHPWFKFLEHAY